MDSTVLDKRRTFLLACACVFVRSCAGASLHTTVLPTSPSNNSRLMLDTSDLDLNKDGCISGKEEMEAFRQHVINALAGSENSVLRAHSIVHRTDVNRDNKICWCDFISIYLHEKASRGKHSVPFLVLPDTVMFTQLDQNKDGQLADDEKERLKTELESCLPHSHAESIVDAIASQLNTDGSISLEEFQEFFNIPKMATSPTSSSEPDKGNNP
uniref:EF-hand domain-containing protein n=1 Tax=Arion vulgaris TaxID=1028688 RepID=A0A0B7AFE3_9EUPU